MSHIIKTKDGFFIETASWKRIPAETANIEDTLCISGTKGVQPLDIYILENNQIVSYFKKAWRLSSLWLVGFQRVNKRIKTCDVIWILDGEPIVQTINREQIEIICNHIECDVYMCGLDPLPWKKFHNDAKKYGWKKEDWCHLLSDDTSNDDEEQDDSDWNPEDELEDESEDDSDIDLDE